jgi:hypothetical protein
MHVTYNTWKHTSLEDAQDESDNRDRVDIVNKSRAD